MKHYLLYAHGGSYNHGAEASIKCDIELLRQISPGCKITLSSHFPSQDIQFGIDADEIIGCDLNADSYEEMYRKTVELISPETVCLSVGGDVYCYPKWQRYAYIHNEAKKRKAKSILWSCSIEPSMIDKEMLSVFRTHDYIFVRESISERKLISLGLDNVISIPDVAFLLREKKTNIPNRKYIAVNLSPLVIRKKSEVLECYQNLIEYIIKNTEFEIALVPHVEMSVDNDYDALIKLKGDKKRIKFFPTGLSAEEYKYVISHSEICIASRTHACIAAYSTNTPVIAIGYSSKSAGIAIDFNQYENMISLDEIRDDILIYKFKQVISQKNEIENILMKYNSRDTSNLIISRLSCALNGE